QAVVKELRTTLLGEAADSKASGEIKADVAAAAVGRGEDPEAHRLFLQGRFLVHRATHGDNRRGIEHLRRALDLNPRHARAWATLSWAETLGGITGMSDLEQAIAHARDAACRALELEPELAEAHLAMGTMQLWYDFDWKGAEASLHHALERAPGSAEVFQSLGILANNLGRPEEALSRCLQAVELDPLSTV